jgi:hypothetical protein
MLVSSSDAAARGLVLVVGTCHVHCATLTATDILCGNLAHHVGAKKIGCRCHILHANKRILAHPSSQLDETPILMLLPVLGSYQIQEQTPTTLRVHITGSSKQRSSSDI